MPETGYRGDNIRLRVPELPCLDEYSIPLAKMAAKCSYLPSIETVKAIGGAVFPTSRRGDKQELFSYITDNDVNVGMYDDNTTPRWALLWAHGIGYTSHPTGWTFAHVWPSRGDRAAYNLANLAMLPECFGTLTDKQGPLTKFLQWHAWETYRWKPEREETPEKPAGYEQIMWKYLPEIEDPKAFIRQRLTDLKNERVKILRPIMEEAGTL
jgi:hypothetical protein